MNLETLLQNLQIQNLNQMQESTLQASEKHNNLVLLSPTGSGKTLAFLFSILNKFKTDYTGIQALILVPARELALQIEQVFKKMGTDNKVTICYGGHDKKLEANSLSQAPSVIIGTPGRIAYHIRNNNFDPSSIPSLVLDEFDKALELGFQEDMSYIISSMKSLENRMLTSATAMDNIPAFAGLKDEKIISFLKTNQIKPDLQYRKVMTTAEEKLESLFRLVCKIGNKRTLIFCNHRDAVDRISELLKQKVIEI
jgi:superfamily II DNA/RNA helicase